jgi:hypothetical protein
MLKAGSAASFKLKCEGFNDGRTRSLEEVSELCIRLDPCECEGGYGRDGIERSWDAGCDESTMDCKPAVRRDRRAACRDGGGEDLRDT